MLNKKWYQDRVREVKSWIKQEKKDIAFAEKQIEFWEGMKKFHEENLKEKNIWLQESEKDLSEYKATSD